MFTTPVRIPPASQSISLSHRLFCVGSCFAQTMGQRWQDNKFAARVNPFGTLYNPVSVFRLMQYALDGQRPDDATYLQRDGYHFNYAFHSDYHAPTRETLQTQIEDTLVQTGQFLRSADWIIITLGSAFVYELRETGQAVANCHQMPATTFRRRLLTVDEIIAAFTSFKAQLDAVNPEAHYLFTVSPVRHVRDTLEQNTVSKATLRLTIEQWRQRSPTRVHYFPAYEIMMDELRDYRYYAADMLHPSSVAQEHIWQRLTDAYLDEEAQRFLNQWTKIRQALEHRPRHPDSAAHRKFLANTLAQLKQLPQQVDVHTEITRLEQLL
ncbi:MAG: GSCFA domain-containing protein [Tunicatimonas sp.]